MLLIHVIGLISLYAVSLIHDVGPFGYVIVLISIVGGWLGLSGLGFTKRAAIIVLVAAFGVLGGLGGFFHTGLYAAVSFCAAALCVIAMESIFWTEAPLR
jgi:hypothetical protein